jgi:DNA mismatch repair ATPase MutS
VVASLKSVEKLKSRASLFVVDVNAQDPITGLFFALLEYIKIQFLLEPIMVFHVLGRLKEKRDAIRNLYEFFGAVDCAISIASMRHGLKNYCQPDISDNHEGIHFIDIYHPLVTDCVPNTLTVKDKSILLTGSNMSGKTTFIRSVAINTLLAQTINTCFASEFRLCPMRIFSAIRISDDVVSGKSYYFEEVLTIKEMIEESRSGKKTLFLLDEIFKGTNTIERIAAGKAVLSYLSKKGNIVFVSTHDIELTGLLQGLYELFHFTEIVEDGTVHFDYALKKGELTTRNAIRILEINGYPQEVIKDAQEISHHIMQEGIAS